MPLRDLDDETLRARALALRGECLFLIRGDRLPAFDKNRGTIYVVSHRTRLDPAVMLAWRPGIAPEVFLGERPEALELGLRPDALSRHDEHERLLVSIGVAAHDDRAPRIEPERACLLQLAVQDPNRHRATERRLVQRRDVDPDEHGGVVRHELDRPLHVALTRHSTEQNGAGETDRADTNHRASIEHAAPGVHRAHIGRITIRAPG